MDRELTGQSLDDTDRQWRAVSAMDYDLQGSAREPMAVQLAAPCCRGSETRGV